MSLSVTLDREVSLQRIPQLRYHALIGLSVLKVSLIGLNYQTSKPQTRRVILVFGKRTSHVAGRLGELKIFHCREDRRCQEGTLSDPTDASSAVCVLYISRLTVNFEQIFPIRSSSTQQNYTKWFSQIFFQVERSKIRSNHASHRDVSENLGQCPDKFWPLRVHLLPDRSQGFASPDSRDYRLSLNTSWHLGQHKKDVVAHLQGTSGRAQLPVKASNFRPPHLNCLPKGIASGKLVSGLVCWSRAIQNCLDRELSTIPYNEWTTNNLHAWCRSIHRCP